MPRRDHSPYWPHSQPEPETEPAERTCARGDWCRGRTVTTIDGKPVIRPAPTPRAFCLACEQEIGTCLDSFPDAYQRLQAELGEPSRNGKPVRVPFGPRIPLREDVDALMRALTETLFSWEERIRTVDHLSQMDTQLSRRRDMRKALTDSCRLLRERLSALTALEPGPMVRDIAGQVTITDLSGTDAGMEIFRLHYLCRAVLGETRPQAESLDGVPCRECEDMALEMAEPPSDPGLEAMYSRCASCGHTMDTAAYRGWAAWYSRWAETAGLPCRRCQSRRCGECQWPACACAAKGHTAA